MKWLPWKIIPESVREEVRRVSREAGLKETANGIKVPFDYTLPVPGDAHARQPCGNCGKPDPAKPFGSTQMIQEVLGGI